MNLDVLNLTGLPAEVDEHITSHKCSSKTNPHMDVLINVLNRVPAAAQRMADHGIPAKIISDTFADVGLWAHRCMRQNGVWGLAAPSIDWLENHLACRIFRVGRYQCIPRYLPDDWNIRFYRNKYTNQVTALFTTEEKFRNDGQFSGTGGVECDASGFTTFFNENADGFTGYMASPKGYAIDKVVELKRGEWVECLKAGMPILELHIPVDGDFKMETCRKSLTDMADFAKNHFDAIGKLTGVHGAFTAFTLSSWLLGTQLDGILPPSSNLVQHLRQYYLLPVLCPEDSGAFWIFDGKEIDYESPQPEDMKTSLQRGVIKFKREGGKLWYNRGVVFLDDVDKFGQGCYR